MRDVTYLTTTAAAEVQEDRGRGKTHQCLCSRFEFFSISCKGLFFLIFFPLFSSRSSLTACYICLLPQRKPLLFSLSLFRLHACARPNTNTRTYAQGEGGLCPTYQEQHQSSNWFCRARAGAQASKSFPPPLLQLSSFFFNSTKLSEPPAPFQARCSCLSASPAIRHVYNQVAIQLFKKKNRQNRNQTFLQKQVFHKKDKNKLKEQSEKIVRT